MSDLSKHSSSPVFVQVAESLGLSAASYGFSLLPAEQTKHLEYRIKQVAKLVANVAGIKRSHALDVLAHAMRFPSWHHLSAHLTRMDLGPESLPSGWLDALSATVILFVAEDGETLPPAQLDALEALGEALSMLTDTPKQKMLDGVSAVLCGGRAWDEVRGRGPLDTRKPLYQFLVRGENDADGGLEGRFKVSAACHQLIEQLDDTWQGYDDFTKPMKRKARAWVEAALAMQPGFLEAGLALAWMQLEEDPSLALSTATETLRQAESLMPDNFKGQVIWGDVENRFYHRLIWLQLKLNHAQGCPSVAARLARKLMRLNPTDDLGVRFVLPLLLLEQGKISASRRSLSATKDEPELTPAAVRAFVAFAEGSIAEFRKELASALFSLPMLRVFLLNSDKALAPNESGWRHVQVDMATFADFAWPSYCQTPGLRQACTSFLAEPAVQKAEQELSSYWAGYWGSLRQPGAVRLGSADGWERLLADCVIRASSNPPS